MRSEDLLATVFPDQVACLENIVGEREIPDHPLVAQTIDDCLHQAMDCEAWLALLRRMEAGKIQLLQEADTFTAGQWQAALIRQPNTPTPTARTAPGRSPDGVRIVPDRDGPGLCGRRA